MRHDLAWGFSESYSGVKTFDAVLPRLVEGIGAVIGFAASKGVKICTENHGHVPVFQCLNILQSSGYRGWIGIEYEGMEPVIDAIAISYENLKRYLSMLK